MTKHLKHVVWEWLPGLVAGSIPLVVFIFIKVLADGPAIDHPLVIVEWWADFYDGLLEHLLVLAMVTSTVSTFTSFPRLFSLNREDAPLGEGSLVLMMLITLVLIFSVVVYSLTEAGEAEVDGLGSSPLVVAFGLAVAAGITSYYMEVTIANVRFQRDGQGT